MACFRDHSPITNRQKPSHPQPPTSPKRPLAGGFLRPVADIVTPFTMGKKLPGAGEPPRQDAGGALRV
jgi:hypothetical protein